MRIVFVAFLIVFIAGCNPAKRLLQEHANFEKIGAEWVKQHPCANDSTFTFLEGKIDSIPVQVPVMDTAIFRHLIDSVKRVIELEFIANNIDCSRQIEESFNTGYRKAMTLCGTIRIPIKQVDTIKTTIVDRRSVMVSSEQIQSITADFLGEKTISAKYLKQRNIAYITIGLAVLLIILLSVLALKNYK